MRIVTEHQHDERVCVMRVHGEIDMVSAPDVRLALEAAVNRGCVHVVMDLARVSYVDSSALGLIVWADRMLEPRGGRLVLAGAGRDVSRVLELSGLVGSAPTLAATADVSEAVVGLELPPVPDTTLWTRVLSFPARAESLASARAEVSEVLRPLALPESTMFDVRVAVGEALSNAIRHGSPQGGGDTVTVDVLAHRDRVVITVTDRGEGFDGTSASGEDVYAASGRGVMFMRALMDHVDFERLPGGGTAVTMVKHR